MPRLDLNPAQRTRLAALQNAASAAQQAVNLYVTGVLDAAGAATASVTIADDCSAVSWPDPEPTSPQLMLEEA